MLIGVLKELEEQRVALIPSDIKKLSEQGYKILVETCAGACANFCDEEYQRSGAEIVGRKFLLEKSNFVISINFPPADDVRKMKKGATLILCYNYNISRPILAQKQMSCFSLNLMPRLSNLQNMDINSSQDMLGGYAAVCQAVCEMKKVIPLTITASGSLYSSVCLVIGLGVFGLSALTTAKKLGAAVFAYDINSKTTELAKSVGAKFIDLSSDKKMSDFLPRVDILITSAFSQGKKAPLLIDEKKFGFLQKGSIVIDAAKRSGGNVFCSEQNKKIIKDFISVYGYTHWADKVPTSASTLVSGSMRNFIDEAFEDEKISFSKDFVKKICICDSGIIN